MMYTTSCINKTIQIDTKTAFPHIARKTRLAIATLILTESRDINQVNIKHLIQIN